MMEVNDIAVDILENLTGEPITFCLDEDPLGEKLWLPASGHMARVGWRDLGPVPAGDAHGDDTLSNLLVVDVMGAEPVELIDVPPQQDGVWYVVSEAVALAATTRDDLLFPTWAVLDYDGVLQGYRRLVKVVR